LGGCISKSATKKSRNHALGLREGKEREGERLDSKNVVEICRLATKGVGNGKGHIEAVGGKEMVGEQAKKAKIARGEK